MERPTTFVTHLEAAIDGTHLDAGVEQTLHAGRPLWVRYDLGAVAKHLTKDALRARPATMWRYHELLPLPFGQAVVTLDEAMTPLIEAPRLARHFDLRQLWIKDESRLPSGSFKARGMAVAVNRALAFGRRRFAVPTNGNAGGALAAYAAAAGAEAFVFMPADTPAANIEECVLGGARTFLVDGLIGDCGRIVREATEAMSWFDLSTLREPYRIEGKKTMGLELAEQMSWRLPDWVLYPTGGGTGLIGMWKAFGELRELGWLADERLPRMVAVQSDGCAPLVRAFERGERFAEPWASPRTVAAGLRVPSAVGDFMILDAVRESGGCAVAVDESRIERWQSLAASLTGLSICPETAACVGALERLAAEGTVAPDDRVALFNTATAAKYALSAPLDLPRIDPAADLRTHLSVIRAAARTA